MSPEDGTGISHKEFFEKALTAAGEWARFARVASDCEDRATTW